MLPISRRLEDDKSTTPSAEQCPNADSPNSTSLGEELKFLSAVFANADPAIVTFLAPSPSANDTVVRFTSESVEQKRFLTITETLVPITSSIPFSAYFPDDAKTPLPTLNGVNPDCVAPER